MTIDIEPSTVLLHDHFHLTQGGFYIPNRIVIGVSDAIWDGWERGRGGGVGTDGDGSIEGRGGRVGMDREGGRGGRVGTEREGLEGGLGVRVGRNRRGGLVGGRGVRTGDRGGHRGGISRGC